MTPFKLVHGVGDYREGTACVMSAAVAEWRLSRGEPLGKATDTLDCVCPVVRRFLMELNDSNLWKNDDHRTAVLTPYIKRVIGTNDGLFLERTFKLVDWAVRIVLVGVMKRAGFGEHYFKLNQLPEIIDAESARVAARATRDVADTIHDVADNTVIDATVIAAYSAAYSATVVSDAHTVAIHGTYPATGVAHVAANTAAGAAHGFAPLEDWLVVLDQILEIKP